LAVEEKYFWSEEILADF